MPMAPFPPDESGRLEDVRAHMAHDDGADDALEAIADAAGLALRCPIALVSLVDEDHQFFGGCVGLGGVRRTPRQVAFCGYTILQDEILEVEDARVDARFSDNPLVIGAPHIVFYAGVPLLSERGYRIGTLCVIDHVPRVLGPDERRQLKALSEAATRVLRKVRRIKGANADLRDALARAETADRARSRFFAGLSHELRTPLNAVIGYADLMLQDVGGRFSREKRQEYMRHILDSGQHLLDLVNDILDLSRLEGGKRQLCPEPISLDEEIARVIAMAAPQARPRQVEIRKDVRDQTPDIHFDPGAFRQILLNLVSNAVKYGRAGGTVEVVAAAHARGVEIEVVDDGPGMTKAVQRNLFQPFARGDRAHIGDVQGTGLGLVLCKALVEASGGAITVASAPGAGTRVRVVAPCARVEAAHRPALQVV